LTERVPDGVPLI